MNTDPELSMDEIDKIIDAILDFIRPIVVEETENFYKNINKAKRIIKEIDELKGVQKHIKEIFARLELEGGVVAALDHPLFLQCQKKIKELQEELIQLV